MTKDGTLGNLALRNFMSVGQKLLLISGTPIQNNVDDLGSMLNILDPSKFPLSEISETYKLANFVDKGLGPLRNDISPYIDR